MLFNYVWENQRSIIEIILKNIEKLIKKFLKNIDSLVLQEVSQHLEKQRKRIKSL